MTKLARPPIPKPASPKPEGTQRRSLTETLWPLDDAPFGPQTLRRRLGAPDALQIRLLLGVPVEKRVKAMLAMQRAVLGNWRRRLRSARPDLSDLELCRLLFQRLRRNG